MPEPTEEIKSKCNRCESWVRVRVELCIERQSYKVCGSCAVSAAEIARLRHQRALIRPHFHAMLNRWTTGLGHYFSSESDARQQQAWYEARCRRYAKQVNRVVARQTLREMAVAS